MKTRLHFTLLAAFALATGMVSAQTTTWIDTAQDSNWFNSANWSNGVPGTGSAVQINNGPDTTIGISGSSVTVSTFSFNVSQSMQILAGGAEQLTVNGSIANSSSFQDEFGLTLNAGANATYAGGSGGLRFDFLNVNTKTIGTSGSVLIGSGGTLVFDINSLSTFGSIGSINASGATINVAGTYTGHAGDSFDLTSGSFTGATLGSLPTLTGGLTWNTSQFTSQGILTVVPEPSTYALLALGMLLLGWLTWPHSQLAVRNVR